jgi:hypothetical protein
MYSTVTHTTELDYKAGSGRFEKEIYMLFGAQAAAKGRRREGEWKRISCQVRTAPGSRTVAMDLHHGFRV